MSQKHPPTDTDSTGSKENEDPITAQPESPTQPLLSRPPLSPSKGAQSSSTNKPNYPPNRVHSPGEGSASEAKSKKAPEKSKSTTKSNRRVLRPPSKTTPTENQSLSSSEEMEEPSAKRTKLTDSVVNPVNNDLSGEDMLPCEICKAEGRKTDKKYTPFKLKIHENDVHKGGITHCIGCGFKSKNQRSTDKHVIGCISMRGHKGNKAKCFASKTCDFTGKSVEQHEKHCKVKHPSFDLKIFDDKKIFRPIQVEIGTDESGEEDETESTIAVSGIQKKKINFELLKGETYSQLANRLNKGVIFKGFEVKINEDNGIKTPFSRPTIEIVLSEFGAFYYFPTFIQWLYSSGLYKAGAVVVRPPDTYEPTQKFDMNKQKVTMHQYEIFSKSPNSEAFTVSRNSRQQSASKDTVSMQDYSEYSVFGNQVGKTLAENEKTFWNIAKDETMVPKLLYASDQQFSLFDDYTEPWNMKRLQNDLRCEHLFWKGEVVAGINTPYVYAGNWFTMFTLHKEDRSLGSISYLHSGGRKIWYVIGPEHCCKMEALVQKVFPKEVAACPGFIRHKSCMIPPTLLDENQIPYTRIAQDPRTFVVLSGNTYHYGWNEGFTLSDAVNYSTREIYPYLKTDHPRCICPLADDFVIPINDLVRVYDRNSVKALEKGTFVAQLPDSEDTTFYPVISDEAWKESLKGKKKKKVPSQLDATDSQRTDSQLEILQQSQPTQSGESDPCVNSQESGHGSQNLGKTSGKQPVKTVSNNLLSQINKPRGSSRPKKPKKPVDV